MRSWLLPGIVGAAFGALAIGAIWAGQSRAPRAAVAGSQAEASLETPTGGDVPNVTPAADHFTLTQFRAHVSTMTKAQIRAEFGQPDDVRASDDTWIYSHAPIYDPEAGVKLIVLVHFAGTDGPNDPVTYVN